MNAFPLFQTVLYTVSTALLYPVVILLTFLCLWMMIYTGGFLAEWKRRKEFRKRGLLADFLDMIHRDKKIPDIIEARLPHPIKRYADDLTAIMNKKTLFTEERIEDLIQRKESALIRDVEKIRIMVRIGPSLGLMGTLIPMGTGLAGLTQGNMAQLSSSLILAFTTTVVGLALGICAQVFSVAKSHWAAEDIRHVQLITEAITKARGETE